jgi:hypothetical protein
METPIIRTREELQMLTAPSPLPPMETLDLAEFDLIDLQAMTEAVVHDGKLKATATSTSTETSSSSLPKPEDGSFRFSDLDLVSEARTSSFL